MRDFRKLTVWQRSRLLVVAAYEHTSKFPAAERYGLTAQIRRAAVSVPANIAEGAGKETRPAYARYLTNAVGSLAELECLIQLGSDLGLSAPSDAARSMTEIAVIRSMTATLRDRVKAK